MIEKLDKHLASNINSCNMSQNVMVAHKAIEKINEIIELLNAITIDVDGTKCVDGSKAPADPYAEQRKWIGKLCKFWDIDNNNLYYGPLTKISDTGPYYYECNHRICYVHCEPVKDDVIYKGGDNE